MSFVFISGSLPSSFLNVSYSFMTNRVLIAECIPDGSFVLSPFITFRVCTDRRTPRDILSIHACLGAFDTQATETADPMRIDFHRFSGQFGLHSVQIHSPLFVLFFIRVQRQSQYSCTHVGSCTFLIGVYHMLKCLYN